MNAAELERGKAASRDEKGEQVAIEGNPADGKGGGVISREGTMTIGDAGALPPPGWMPPYPGARPVGNVARRGVDGESGMHSFLTSDPLDRVLSRYQARLEGAGFKVERAGAEGQGGVAGSLTAQHPAEARSVSISAVGAEGGRR